MQRSRQKKTMASIRNIAVAVESYNNDFGQLPTAGSMPALKTLLSSQGYRFDQPRDAWGNDMIYSTANQHYTIESYARDGLDGPLDITRITRDLYENDIVLADGTFINSPDT